MKAATLKKDAPPTEAPDPWLLQVKLNRVEQDLERALRNAEEWKTLAQAATQKTADLQAAVRDLRKQLGKQKTDLSTREEAASTHLAELRDTSDRLLSEKEALAEEAADLRSALDSRIEDIAALGRELKQRDQRIAHERDRRLQETATLGTLLERRTAKLRQEQRKRDILAQLSGTREQNNSTLLMPLRVRRYKRAQNRLKEDMRLIAASGLFDAKWYSETYPDIATSGADPLRHFAQHGAYELRNPGPGFDSLAYHEANPDVTAHGMAALIHYVRSGKSEGRKAFDVSHP